MGAASESVLNTQETAPRPLARQECAVPAHRGAALESSPPSMEPGTRARLTFCLGSRDPVERREPRGQRSLTSDLGSGQADSDTLAGPRGPWSMCPPSRVLPNMPDGTFVLGHGPGCHVCVATPGVQPSTRQARDHCRWEKHRQKEHVRASSLPAAGSRAPRLPARTWLVGLPLTLPLYADFPVCIFHSALNLPRAESRAIL